MTIIRDPAAVDVFEAHIADPDKHDDDQQQQQSDGASKKFHHSINPDRVDALLAHEMTQLSFEERELVYEEIHGVEAVIEETPEMLEKNYFEMEIELGKIEIKKAYDQAVFMDGEYVKSLRLQFLRADNFVPKNAAKRIVKFMEVKLKYFGPETLARPIYITDLDKQDMAVLKQGSMHLLPSRDRAGRVIFGDFNLVANATFDRVENVIKSFMYIIQSAIEDELTQKRGMVFLFYLVGAKSLFFDRELNNSVSYLLECLPFRLSAVHICFDDPRLRMIKALLMITLGSSRRVRVRIHDGTHMECQYSLMTFGVPVSAVPVTNDGEVKLTNLSRWVARRKVKDAALANTGTFEGIDLPLLDDVLVGRGKPIGDHGGNIKLRQLVSAHQDEYEAATKIQKTEIVTKVVNITKKYPARFLKKSKEGWWIEASDKEAHAKVGTCFRSARSMAKSQQQQEHTPYVGTAASKRIRIDANFSNQNDCMAGCGGRGNGDGGGCWN